MKRDIQVTRSRKSTKFPVIYKMSHSFSPPLMCGTFACDTRVAAPLHKESFCPPPLSSGWLSPCVFTSCRDMRQCDKIRVSRVVSSFDLSQRPKMRHENGAKSPTDSHPTPGSFSQDQGAAARWDTWETSFPPMHRRSSREAGEQGREHR